MEKNYLGLNQSQENLLLLLAEGNTQQEISALTKLPYYSIVNAFKTIREILEARTNEHAVALLFRDLCTHGNIEKKAAEKARS